MVFLIFNHSNKAVPIGKTVDAVKNTNSSIKKTKIVVPLKYSSNFWISLEMPLMNCETKF